MPEDGFAGSMVATMSLSSNGECTGNPPNLDPVCVKSPTHRTYQYTLDDGSVWQANCETTYENCEDPGTENCSDFMISPPVRQVVSSWEEEVQNGCATCYQTITQYSDGSVDFSDLHGCEYSGCGEENNPINQHNINDTAINNLDTLPCAKNIADSIMKLGTTNSFGQLINNMLNLGGSGFDVSITFNFKEMIDDLVSGNTTGSGSTGHQKNNINLNTILMNSSQEFIAATLLHELMHAYLRTINTYAMSYPSYTNPILDSINYLRSQGYSGEALSHEAIARYFIDDMVNGLTGLFPNLLPQDALALAWGGLSETSGWVSKNETEKYNILLYNQQEKFHQPGASGTFCR